MEIAIQKLAALSFLVIGLSHVLRPQAWVGYFTWLRQQGEAGVYLEAFVYLQTGTLIVAFHDVWSGIPAVLTALGWAYVLKSLIRFCRPEIGLQMMARVSAERAHEFQIAGAALLGLAALLGWQVLH
jgi:hypothetical protein